MTTGTTTADLNIAIWRMQTAIHFQVATDASKCLKPPVISPTEPTVVHKEILGILHAQHRQVDCILGDGNCLFRALSKAIYGVQTGHIALRVLLTSFIMKNEVLFVGLCDTDVKEHCSMMSKEAVYGTQAELQAAASYFQVPIFVLDKPCEKIGWRWMKYTPFDPTTIDFTGNPTILSPPTRFRIEILLHAAHFDRIAPREGYEASLPWPMLKGKREHWGLIK